MQKLRDMLLEHMEKTGKSANQLAAETGISHPTIGRILYDEPPVMPKLETLMLIAQVLNVNPLKVIAAALGIEFPFSVTDEDLIWKFSRLDKDGKELTEGFIDLILKQKNRD